MKYIAMTVIAVTLVGNSAAATAFVFCSEPREPICLTMKIGDWDESDFDRCRMEVRSYIDELQRWQDCIVDDANARAKKAVDKFNCYAKGSSFCM
jgi:hypothetical protein